MDKDFSRIERLPRYVFEEINQLAAADFQISAKSRKKCHSEFLADFSQKFIFRFLQTKGEISKSAAAK